ncbi:MAG: HEAT repeat domain-containing protein [Acidobacteriota bacterium]
MNQKLSRLAAIVIVSLTGCAQMRQVELRKEIEQIHNLRRLLESNPFDKASLTQLTGYLTHENRTIRTQATSVAGNLGVHHCQALGDALVPLLIEKLEDEDPYVRRYAVKGLGQYGAKAEPAVGGLVRVLMEYKAEDSSWLAADALGNLGPAARSAVPALIKSLDEKGPEGSIHEFTMQKSASMALYKLSPLGSDAMPELRRRLSGLAGEARLYAALAILKGQPTDTQGTDALASVLIADRRSAGVALREIDQLPAALFDLRVLLPALQQASKSTDSYIRDLSSKQFARLTARTQ